MRGFTKLKKKHILKISAVYLTGNPKRHRSYRSRPHYVKFFGGFLENFKNQKDILKLSDLYLPTLIRYVLYYVSLFIKIRCSLTYLLTYLKIWRHMWNVNAPLRFTNTVHCTVSAAFFLNIFHTYAICSSYPQTLLELFFFTYILWFGAIILEICMTKGRCNYGVAIFLLQVYPKTQRTKNFIFIFSLIILMQTSVCML